MLHPALVGAGPMTSPWGCQSVVCSGGRCLAQLRDPGISALSQHGVRVGAPRATSQLTPLPSMEPEVLSPRGPCQLYPLATVRPQAYFATSLSLCFLISEMV